jgi:DnaK suppressor protein
LVVALFRGELEGVQNDTDKGALFRTCCVTQETDMTDNTIRNEGLKLMLRERRRQLQNEVQRRMRDGRTDRPTEVRDDLEHSGADIQGDIEFSLLQMTAETLTRIDAALVRLDAGKYGSCFECAGEISEARLRALPFAVRCQACEERREQAQGQSRQLTQRRSGPSLFSDVIGS